MTWINTDDIFKSKCWSLSRVWLCNPKDCSPPGSYVHGILQARILEWVAVSFSRGSSWPRDQTWVSCTAGRFSTTWAPREATRQDTILSEISQSEMNAVWSLQGSCLESPRDGEPGGLQAMGSLRVGQGWATSLSLFTFMHWRRQRQPIPVFLPGEPHGRRSLEGCSPWGH